MTGPQAELSIVTTLILEQELQSFAELFHVLVTIFE